MAKKRFGPEQVVAKLRQIEVLQPASFQSVSSIFLNAASNMVCVLVVADCFWYGVDDKTYSEL